VVISEKGKKKKKQKQKNHACVGLVSVFLNSSNKEQDPALPPTPEILLVS
jgi:hypothetical protein